MQNPIIEYYNRFIKLPPEEIKIIEENSKTITLKKKEILYKQGDTHLSSSLVIKGCLRVFFTDKNGIEFNRFFAFEDWWVGELYQLENNLPATNSVQALEDCTLITLDKPSFFKIMKTCPTYAKFTHTLAGKGYSNLLEREQQKIVKSAEELYTELLTKHPNITQRISIKHIASYLGINPDSLSRIRRKLAKK